MYFADIGGGFARHTDQRRVMGNVPAGSYIHSNNSGVLMALPQLHKIAHRRVRTVPMHQERHAIKRQLKIHNNKGYLIYITLFMRAIKHVASHVCLFTFRQL